VAISIAESLKKQMKAAKKEYRAKRKELEKALASLEKEYAFVLGLGGGSAGAQW